MKIQTLLVKDYSNAPSCEAREEPVLRLVTMEELLEEIQRTRHDMTYKIAVYDAAGSGYLVGVELER